MLRIWLTDGREHLKQLTTGLPLRYKYIILYKKTKHFNTPKSSQVARKIITLRDELGVFIEPKDLLQLPELTTLEWQEWKEQGIVINID